MPQNSTLKSCLGLMLRELSAVFDRVDEASVLRLADAVLAAKTVFASGAGRSGLLLRCAAMRLMHLGKAAYVVGEIVTPAIGSGDLLLVASGSGETGSLVNMSKRAKSLGAHVALITANDGSAIAGLADVVVKIPAPSPKAELRDFVVSEQPMGNLFEQSALLLLDAVVMELMARTGMTSETMFEKHANLE